MKRDETRRILKDNLNPRMFQIFIDICNAHIDTYRKKNDSDVEDEVKHNQGAIRALKAIINDFEQVMSPKNYVE